MAATSAVLLSALYVREDVQILSDFGFLLDFHQVWKENGKELVNWPLPWTYLKELVFLHHEYYSIFLLQQAGSKCPMKYCHDKQQR
jgi:hypothetical protein